MVPKQAVFTSVSPLVPTGVNFTEALQFYREQLGFCLLWQSEQGAGIQRGEVVFMLVDNNNRDWMENSSFSLGVSDLEALYEEYAGVAAQVGPLEMKPLGEARIPHDRAVGTLSPVL